MRNSKRKVQGVAAVEFVGGFIAFWFMCMLWVEMSYMSYISAINDYVITESAREVKTEQAGYLLAFRQAIEDSSNLWGSIIDPANFRLSINYIQDIAALEGLENPCEIPDGQNVAECGNEENSAIAVYNINYDFNPIFTFFIDTETILSREVIVIQEYERDQFDF